MQPPSFTTDLAAAVTTFNCGRTIARCLDSVRDLASRIVVIDSGSTDDTIDLCKSRGAEVIQREWPGHSAQKQFALDQCRGHRWVLVLDSDESVEPDLRESIRRAVAEDDDRFAAYTINRKLWYRGGWLHHVHQPDRILRLVRGGAGRMNGHPVHASMIVDGRVGRLDGTLRHDSWIDLADLRNRNIHYARLMAAHADRRGSIPRLLISPAAAIFKQLILKRAFLDGPRGIIIALMAGHATLLKHWYILRENSPRRATESHGGEQGKEKERKATRA